MSRGDYEWALNELENDLGEKWANDDYGHALLHMALYEPGEHSPDFYQSAYEILAGNGDDIAGYFAEEYDYDFEDQFDWDAYREWYDSA